MVINADNFKSERKGPFFSAQLYRELNAAIGVEIGQIIEHARKFEVAANWYLTDRRRPMRLAPSKMVTKLDSISNNVRRLLRSLSVSGSGEAEDGPRDREILAALMSGGERNEDPIIEATRRIGRLAEICEGVAAAPKLAQRADQAAIEFGRVGALTVRPGNSGDDAINDWIAAMMGIYRSITGREPATSVGCPGYLDEGIASGPLIRFLKAVPFQGLSDRFDWLRNGGFSAHRTHGG